MTISKKLAALSLAVSLSLFSVTPAVMAAKAVPKDVNYLLGMYYGSGSVFLLREDKGTLQIVYPSSSEEKKFSMANIFPLKKVRFDSYTLYEEGPLVTMEAPVHFERDTDGNGIACKIGGKKLPETTSR